MKKEDEPRLSHLDEQGRARMVDVGGKAVTHRRALARAEVVMRRETLEMIVEDRAPKGDVLAVARVAGIIAAKKTADLIPMCHPLSLTHVTVDLEPMPPEPGEESASVEIRVACETAGRTGVEMEALTAASVAALTLYDMCKAVDRGMVIREVMLLEKEGGASGSWKRG